MVYDSALEDVELIFPYHFLSTGLISRSRFRGFALLEALADSTGWQEDYEVAKKIAAKKIADSNSLTLHFSKLITNTSAPPYQRLDVLMSTILGKYPVLYFIKRLRFDSLIDLIYLVLNDCHAHHPSLRLSGVEQYWRICLTGVETIEVFCNNPMLPSSHDEAKLMTVLEEEMVHLPYMGHMLLHLQHFALFLSTNMPGLKQIHIKNSRKCYIVGLDRKGREGFASLKLDSIETLKESPVEYDAEYDSYDGMELNDD